MRITNQMMTNNMLAHVNQNKMNMSSLENQYSTGKKIQKPSEDPIIAVRALKLRSSITEISQYLDTNIPDALSWMTVTESALDNVNEMLIKMSQYCDQGANDTLTASQRKNILQNLEHYTQQIYQEGNTNYAGRYVFTGFKTDTPLIFTEDKTFKADNGGFAGYQITQKLDATSVKKHSTVSIPDDIKKPAQTVESNRIQLAYSKLVSVTGITMDGTDITITKTIQSTDQGAYEPGDDEVYVLADTGEIILGSGIAKQFEAAKDISVSYQKSSFKTTDLLPEHYFDCTLTDEKGNTTKFEKSSEDISYEVNFGQNIKVNTEAKTAITHDLARMIDDLNSAVSRVTMIEDKMAGIKESLKSNTLSKDEEEELKASYEQLELAHTLATSVMQQTFSKSITTTQKYQDTVNVASADLGARYNRLLLTQSRLTDQKVELEDLKSSNEDVDLVETIIRYKSAEAVYTSSLSAISSVIKRNLLDFL